MTDKACGPNRRARKSLGHVGATASAGVGCRRFPLIAANPVLEEFREMEPVHERLPSRREGRVETRHDPSPNHDESDSQYQRFSMSWRFLVMRD
jgi:hypothetical protein